MSGQMYTRRMLLGRLVLACYRLGAANARKLDDDQMGGHLHELRLAASDAEIVLGDGYGEEVSHGLYLRLRRAIVRYDEQLKRVLASERV